MEKHLLRLVIDNIRKHVIDNSFSGMEFGDFLTHLETLTISIVKFKTDITANCHTIIHRHFEIPEPTGNITTLCADSKYIAWRVRKFGRQTCFFLPGEITGSFGMCIEAQVYCFGFSRKLIFTL